MLRSQENAADFTFVTYDGLPDLDPDDRLAVDALRQRGVTVNAAVWTDPQVDWSKTGTCVIRSAWDYHRRIDAFVAWVRHVSSLTRLVNSAALVRWNIRKTYLADLERSGIPIVPTRWRGRGDTLGLQDVPWRSVVIKPVVGLATAGVKRFDLSMETARAESHLDALLAQGDAMIQPYLDSVEPDGERALVFIGGAFSHAVSKAAFQPLLPAGEAGETAAQARPDEVPVAAAAVAALPEPAVYARVDLVRDANGAPRVLELELIEPSLFLAMHPSAAEAFADVLIQLSGSAARPKSRGA